MIFLERAVKLSKYSIVGLLAAGVHALALMILSRAFPLWLSNLSGFLGGSLVSYLGHSLYTFRKATKGKRFSRRWLFSQFTANATICSVSPVIFSSIEQLKFTAWIFIFTPTLVNALIWSAAARFSFKRNQPPKCTPLVHADDLGLTHATNKAIFQLLLQGNVNSASILVNGNSVKQAIDFWKKRISFPLMLHLSLTEGRSIGEVHRISNNNGCLNQTFGKLLLVSLLPKRTSTYQKTREAIKEEVLAQIRRFKLLTNLNKISIDGHQHVHLIPIVLEVLLEVSISEGISWIRTTSEPLPGGISWKDMASSIYHAGFIKWVLLTILNYIAIKQIQQASIKTNAGFAGILFTGRMHRKIITSSFRELEVIEVLPWQTEPIILIHPAETLQKEESSLMLDNFPLSRKFFSCGWRQKEWLDLQNIKN